MYPPLLPLHFRTFLILLTLSKLLTKDGYSSNKNLSQTAFPNIAVLTRNTLKSWLSLLICSFITAFILSKLFSLSFQSMVDSANLSNEFCKKTFVISKSVAMTETFCDNIECVRAVWFFWSAWLGFACFCSNNFTDSSQFVWAKKNNR